MPTFKYRHIIYIVGRHRDNCERSLHDKCFSPGYIYSSKYESFIEHARALQAIGTPAHKAAKHFLGCALLCRRRKYWRIHSWSELAKGPIQPQKIRLQSSSKWNLCDYPWLVSGHTWQQYTTHCPTRLEGEKWTGNRLYQRVHPSVDPT